MDCKITTKNLDTTFKDSLLRYKDQMVDFLKIDCAKILDVEPTELPEIEAYVNNTDFIFKLSDETLLHFEFQSTYSSEDIERFMLYDTRLFKKEKRKIRTVVVCKKSKKLSEKIDAGAFTYNLDSASNF